MRQTPTGVHRAFGSGELAVGRLGFGYDEVGGAGTESLGETVSEGFGIGEIGGVEWDTPISVA